MTYVYADSHGYDGSKGGSQVTSLKDDKVLTKFERWTQLLFPSKVQAFFALFFFFLASPQLLQSLSQVY